MPGVTTIAADASGDPTFRSPDDPVQDGKRHRWFPVTGEGIDHHA